jgi:PAS domain S-box-containing protein
MSMDEDSLRLIVDTIPAMVWTALPNGSRDFVNRRWLEYTGLSFADGLGNSFAAMHPEDRARFLEEWQTTLATGKPLEMELRQRRADGEYRWFFQVIVPQRDSSGNIVKWYAKASDIEDRKRAENELRKSETKYRSLIDLSPAAIYVLSSEGNFLSANPAGLELLQCSAQQALSSNIASTYLPDELSQLGAPVENINSGVFRFERSFRRCDGSCIPVEISLSAMLPEGRQAIVQDISERKRAAATLKKNFEEVKRSQDYLRSVLDSIPAMVWINDQNSSNDFCNRRWLEYTGVPYEEGTQGRWKKVVHPDDIELTAERWRLATQNGQIYEVEKRLRGADGTYRWFQSRAIPIRDATGEIVRWYGAETDIEDLKQAQKKTELQEQQLRQIIDLIPHHIVIIEPDGSSAYTNHVAREFFGPVAHEAAAPRDFLAQVTHPEELERMTTLLQESLASGLPFEMEARMRGKDGLYRWFLHQALPIRDEQGKIIRWCGLRVDIDDGKRAEERTYKENLVLREEIDKVSMFEEIVGTSPALQAVLARVTKVARTDSTVLITGETGTGKELIARAIHKRSLRAARAFVSVNCAAIPRDLIASELFGHEKGAFTGALQRRLGRFELADGGTLFLDEVGELPAETQVALLRVLQEREFERMGGGQPIRTDVRVITATNRDLPAAITAGTFRSDLFYRINVFPIEIPPLRERREDIRLLVEYFIDRYSSKAGKKIRRIDKKSLDRLQSYPWPGNIRELQNVIERSVIVCDTEDFSVDESWLSHERSTNRPLSDEIVAQEKELIAAALAKTRGRVSGPSGAAARLGMPASTLDSKIKSLKIDKRRFTTL